jgi:hypothetical protein
MTVSGFTIARAFRTVGANRYSPAKTKRSAVLKVCLPVHSTCPLHPRTSDMPEDIKGHLRGDT